MNNLTRKPIIGRTECLETVIDLLNNPACKLVTLVGSGGIGKTRLALAVAQHFAASQPVFVFTLHNIQTSAQFLAGLANVLNIRLRGDESVLEQIICCLPSEPTLIVLDNFEAVLDAADTLSDLLAEAPQVRFLVTSRVVLRLQDEWVYEVSGLTVPTMADNDALNNSAVRLFIERATRIHQNFDAAQELDAIVRICQLVRGNPLALELAATWVRTLTCQQIADELQQGLGILNTNLRDIESRHRSMEAVFEQSWKLLSPDEQDTFKRLSVFRSDFSQDAACAVSCASFVELSNLVDHSIVQRVGNGRYEIHDLLRTFAFQRLDEETRIDTQCQLAYYIADYVEQQTASLKTHTQREALDCIEAEFNHVMQAWEWAIQQQETVILEKMLLAIILYAPTRSRHLEGYHLLSMATVCMMDAQSLLSPQLILAYGWFTFWKGKIDTALAHIQHGLVVLDAMRVRGRGQLPMVLSILSWYENHENVDFAELYQRYQQELAHYQQQGDDWGAAWILYGMGNISRTFGDYDKSYAELEASVKHFNNVGDGWGKTWALGGFCTTLRYLNRFDEAIVYYEKLWAIAQALGDNGAIIYALHGIGYSTQAVGDLEGALRYYLEAVKLTVQTGSIWNMLDAVLRIGEILALQRATPIAVELFAAVQNHPMTQHGWLQQRRDKAAQGLQNLHDKIAPNEYQAALLRGTQTDLRTLIDRLLTELAQPVRNPAMQQPLFEPLSEREFEVLNLLVLGHSNRQIAAELVLALGTVKTHIHNIYGKLNVSNRTEAAAQARAFGLIE